MAVLYRSRYICSCLALRILENLSFYSSSSLRDKFLFFIASAILVRELFRLLWAIFLLDFEADLYRDSNTSTFFGFDLDL